MNAQECIDKFKANCSKQYLSKVRNALVASRTANLPPSAAASKRAATTPKRPAAPVTPVTRTPIHLQSGEDVAGAFVSSLRAPKKSSKYANQERQISFEYDAEYDRIKHELLDEARDENSKKDKGKSHKKVATIIREFNDILNQRFPDLHKLPQYSLFNSSTVGRWLQDDVTKETEHGSTKIIRVFLDSMSSLVRANQAAGNTTNSNDMRNRLDAALEGSPRSCTSRATMDKWRLSRPASAATTFVVPVEMRRHLWCTIQNYETWVKALSSFYVELGFGVEEVTDNDGCPGTVRMFKGGEHHILNAVSL